MKTVVIAEIGSNWETIDDILYSCEWAVRHHCLPKLQAFQVEHFVNKERNPGMYETLLKYQIPERWYHKINNAFPDTIYSVFDIYSLDIVRSLKRTYPVIKIASPDCVYSPLVDAIEKTGENVIVSVGGATLDEIRQVARKFPFSKITLMECNASYPAKLAYLGNLRDRIIGSRLIPWGYSNHTLSLSVPAFAVALGATVVENHFKMVEFNSPDNDHSLGQNDFAEMLERINDAEKHMGTLEHPYPEEEKTMRLARRKEDGLR